MNKKLLSKNLIITLSVYGILLVLNIFVSKVVLISYGSEVNGLLASVNQIYTYIALLEAGIGTATITSLYGPFAKKDNAEINRICSASVAYYRVVLKWYVLCVIAVSFLWPFVLESSIGYWTIFSVILIQGISNALTFYYVSTTTNYLVAVGKNYVNVYIHMGITAVTYLSKAAVSLLGGNVLLISATLLGINGLKCLFYYMYKKAKCTNLRFDANTDFSILKQRRSFLIHEIVGVIFSSTDLVLISIFCDLKMASVYAVYSMVISAVSSIIGQVFNSTKYILGEGYHKENYEKTHDIFNTIYITIVFALYTITYLLFEPFIGIYTRGVEDINYAIRFLPILFILIQLLSTCRNVDTILIKNAGHSKQTINRAIIEAGINLTTSVVLLCIIGIHGVLLGTVVALLYRTNDMIIYANKRILKRSSWKEYKLYLLNFLVFCLFLVFNHNFPLQAFGYADLLYKAIGLSIIVITVYVVVNATIFGKKIITHIKHKSRKK